MQEQIMDQKPKPKLKSNVDKIIIHTDFAKSLFTGSWKHGKYGLVQFAKLVSSIYMADKNDDPYATLFLLKIYQAINEARSKIKLIELNCQSQLDGLRGFEISLFQKKRPFKFPLAFSNKFSYAASPIITDIDYVTRLRLTLNRIGMMVPEESTPVGLYSVVEKVFNLPTEWVQLDIKREDIINSSEKSKKAHELWGEIPAAILNKEIKFNFLPSLSKVK